MKKKLAAIIILFTLSAFLFSGCEVVELGVTEGAKEIKEKGLYAASLQCRFDMECGSDGFVCLNGACVDSTTLPFSVDEE